MKKDGVGVNKKDSDKALSLGSTNKSETTSESIEHFSNLVDFCCLMISSKLARVCYKHKPYCYVINSVNELLDHVTNPDPLLNCFSR